MFVVLPSVSENCTWESSVVLSNYLPTPWVLQIIIYLFIYFYLHGHFHVCKRINKILIIPRNIFLYPKTSKFYKTYKYLTPCQHCSPKIFDQIHYLSIMDRLKINASVSTTWNFITVKSKSRLCINQVLERPVSCTCRS